MNTETRSRRGRWKIAACVLLAAVALGAAGFFWYVSDDYRADEIALEVLARDGGVTVQDDLTVLSPSYPTDTGLIFYPGAKVEGTAYLPLLDQLRQTGLTCVLVEMPFHLAIFDADAAEDVMEQFPDIQHWYIAGHSLGGAMASQFAADHPDEIDYTENVVEIQGGNHAQFGNYGPQKGDAPATISAEEQQARTVEAVAEFIARRQG